MHCELGMYVCALLWVILSVLLLCCCFRLKLSFVASSVKPFQLQGTVHSSLPVFLKPLVLFCFDVCLIYSKFWFMWLDHSLEWELLEDRELLWFFSGSILGLKWMNEWMFRWKAIEVKPCSLNFSSFYGFYMISSCCHGWALGGNTWTALRKHKNRQLYPSSNVILLTYAHR